MKKILSVLLCICMVMALIPATVMADEINGVYINGVNFPMGDGSTTTYYKNDGTDGSESDWNAKLYDDNGTLTLALKDFEYNDEQTGIYATEDLKIVLEGTENSITTTSTLGYGIWVQGDLEITGNDTGKIVIDAEGDYAIEANTQLYEDNKNPDEYATITINGVAEVNAEGRIGAISAEEAVIIIDSNVAAEGDDFGIKGGGYYQGQSENITIKGESDVYASGFVPFYSAPIVEGDFEWIGSNDAWQNYTENTQYEEEWDDTFELRLKYVHNNDGNTELEYYLVGSINNSDYYEKEYKFIDGKIEFKFTSDSYVAVMDSEKNIYQTDGWIDFDPTEATLKLSGNNKMHISSKSDNRTLWLTVNDDGTLTLTTYEPIKTYTVSFDANGGTGEMADVNDVTGDYELPECTFTAPSGKQFKAWSVDDSEKNVGDTITVSANTTVKAIWEDIQSDDEEDDEEETLEYYLVGKISMVDTYECKEEYKFVDGKIEIEIDSATYVGVLDSKGNFYFPKAWIDFDATEGVLYSGYSSVDAMHIGNSGSYTLWLTVNDDGTLTLTTYEPIKTYTVSFDANGGSVSPKTATTNAEGKLTTIPTPSRSGSYTFNGWYTAAKGGTQVTVDTVFEADTTIYAQWTSNKKETLGSLGGNASGCKVKFDTNGGSKIANRTVSAGSKFAEPSAPTKIGYTFGGWYTDEELTIPYDFDAKVTKSITLYAKWVEAGATHTCPSDKFNDLDSTKWYHEDVDYVIENEIMLGTTDTEFAPEESLTRGMLVTILYRSENEPATNKSIPFADVDMSAYYAKAVVWAQQNEIVKGISETEFAPDMLVTREQLATIMFRYAQFKGMDAVTAEENLGFEDASDISEWAVSAMNWGVGRDYIFSRTEGEIAPKVSATRAEIAAFIHRYIVSNEK